MDFELSSSGRSALKDHVKEKNIKKFYRKKNNFFLPKIKAIYNVIEEPTNSVADGQQTLKDVFASTYSVRAEIMWTLKNIMIGYSVCSNDDLSLTFAAMIHKLTRTFNMARTKSMCVINHGLAPYFKSLLKTSVDRSDIFSFLFDECLNEGIETSEMDLNVRL